jgi:hypothetical protein
MKTHEKKKQIQRLKRTRRKLAEQRLLRKTAASEVSPFFWVSYDQ